MNKRLAELVLRICSEKNGDQKLALIEELKELLDAEDERPKPKSAKPAFGDKET